MRTQYISRKFLQNNLGLILSYRGYCNAIWLLRNYPECKYYYVDKKTGEFKPSNRK